jgi:hypothetical protein
MADETAPKTVGSVGPPWLDLIERLAKLAAIVAIPVVIPIALAFYSAKVQEGAQKESINRDYVQLAVSILKEKKEDMSPELRNWATDLLTEHSPTKFAPNVITGLKSGALLFPGLLQDSYSVRVEALSPDGRLLATADSLSYGITDIVAGKRILIADTVQRPTALDFSPDSSILAVGFANGDVSLVRATSAGSVRGFKTPQPVAAVRMTVSGQIHVISSTGSVFIYDNNGNLLRKFLAPSPPADFKAIAR